MNDDIKKENSTNYGGQSFDTENVEATIEGGENCDKISETQKAANDIQKETAFGQVSGNIGQNESDTRDTQEDVTDSAKYSATYAPPYYVPNFESVSETVNTKHKNKSSKRRKSDSGFIALLSTVCFLLVLAIIILATLLLSRDMITGGFGFGDSHVDIFVGNKDVNIVDKGEQEVLSIPEIVSRVSDSVVEITTRQVTHNPFYGNYVTGGAGSGVIVAQNGNMGYIVTNHHVVAGADKMIVTVNVDGERMQYEATYRAGDAREDIAVITISLRNGETLSQAQFRDLESSPLLVGESVIAIGNPLGELGGTVTNGIISALDREITIDGNKMTLLQTNAAVNPGNSGGGLFDSTGMLIGIVNAKESDSGIEGLGFAIPADRVLKNVTDILEIGYITGRAGLGISVYAANGVYGVYAVESSGVFKADDRIVAINGEAIHTLSDYNAVLSELTIGETVTVVVMRDNNSYKEFEVKVIEDESK